ncbi:tyrosyl-tRNA synthetase, partial [Kickxella alabastrina]
MNILSFLGQIGRYARVGTMIARDSVKSRLQSEQGISFTEFSYQLLQAYDFWYLYHHYGCRIQLGGSDQWGNITAGTDLIHRMPFGQDKDDTGVITSRGRDSADDAYGLTIPLLTTASGEKFGKSAGNAIWLDESKTSAFDIYQFFVKTADTDVERFLKLFTLLPISEISRVMAEHHLSPEGFAAQRLLATEVTELIHGESGVNKALCATEVLFGNRLDSIQKYSQDDFAEAFAHDQRMVSVSKNEVTGKSLGEIAVLVGSCKSKSEATRLARGGGLYWNNQPVDDSKWVPSVTATNGAADSVAAAVTAISVATTTTVDAASIIDSAQQSRNQWMSIRPRSADIIRWIGEEKSWSKREISRKAKQQLQDELAERNWEQYINIQPADNLKRIVSLSGWSRGKLSAKSDRMRDELAAQQQEQQQQQNGQQEQEQEQ